MRSSTSSSDQHLEQVEAPAGDWARAVLLAAIVAGATLLAIELTWITLGHRPNLRDDPQVWALERGRALGERPRDRIALLGSSRLQLAVDTRRLAALEPERGVAMLAIDGRGPAAALLDLAADPGFHGIAVVELLPEDLEPARLAGQQPWVDAYRRGQPLERRLERWLQARVQGSLTFANPSLRLPLVADALISRGAPPRPYHIRTWPDRARAGDFARADLVRARAARFARDSQRYAELGLSAPEAWLGQALALDAAAQRIVARGGAVAFLRMPVDAERAAFDEQRYPSADYWDRFAAAARAPTIDAWRDPAAAFATPDASHIDQRDRPAFTEWLHRRLAAAGAFAAEAGR